MELLNSVTNKRIVLFGFFTLFALKAFSQYGDGRVEISIQNFSSASNYIEFDVYLRNVSLAGISGLKLSAFGGGLKYNSSMLPSGASGSFSVVSQPSSNAFPSLNNITVLGHAMGSGENYIRWNQSPTMDDAISVSMPSGASMKFGRFRLTSSIPWTILPSLSAFDLQWYQGTAASIGKPQTVVYYNGSNNPTAVNFFTEVSNRGMIVIATPSFLTLTLFIEGFMDGVSMRPVKTNAGFSVPSLVCDDITVELHDATTPYFLAHSFSGQFQTNGVISCSFSGSVAGNNYYIVVKHRNSIETWSSAPVLFGSNTVYNFSTAAIQAYGANLVQVNPGQWCIYSGDIDANPGGDGYVDFSDYSVWEFDFNNSIPPGYYHSDLNGDGYSDFSDYSIWELNFNNGIFIQTPP